MMEETDIVVVNSENPSLKPIIRSPQKTPNGQESERLNGDEEGHIVEPKDIKVRVSFESNTEDHQMQSLVKNDKLQLQTE